MSFGVSSQSKAPVTIRTYNKLLHDRFKLDGWVNDPTFVHTKFSLTPKPAVIFLALDCTRLLINRLLSNYDTFVTSPVTLSPKITLTHCTKHRFYLSYSQTFLLVIHTLKTQCSPLCLVCSSIIPVTIINSQRLQIRLHSIPPSPLRAMKKSYLR